MVGESAASHPLPGPSDRSGLSGQPRVPFQGYGMPPLYLLKLVPLLPTPATLVYQRERDRETHRETEETQAQTQTEAERVIH